MALKDANSSERILILAPFGKDSQHLCGTLSAEGLVCFACKDITELIQELARGALAILTTEEVIGSGDATLLIDALKAQPTWSAIPVLLFYSSYQVDYEKSPRLVRLLQHITDVALLPRPVSSMVLLNAVRSAIRDRKRQYETKGLLEKLQAEVEFRANKEIELQKAKAGAESASLLKSQFLANMSHEIRTPLGVIMGYSELMLQPGSNPEERKNYISVVLRNSQQLLRIIDDILDLSKVEAGKMSFEAVSISVASFLKDISEAFDLRARENGIQFSLVPSKDIPKFILSDPTRLRQILTNIIGNAIKFTSSGKVEINITFNNGFLNFEVRDTGRGISAEQAKSLFKPFIQADAATNRKYGGTGLGLALTKKLCNAMGGDFFLKESELGKGSTFVAFVKTGEVQSPLAKKTPLMNSQSKNGRLLGRRILVVEDSPDNQALIRILLSKEGAQVEIASDGIEGVEKATQDNYSAILMDVQMPRMGGVEAVQQMRAQGLDLPVIALTAHAMIEEQKRCMDAGFSYFLTKPLNKTELIELLHSL